MCLLDAHPLVVFLTIFWVCLVLFGMLVDYNWVLFLFRVLFFSYTVGIVLELRPFVLLHVSFSTPNSLPFLFSHVLCTMFRYGACSLCNQFVFVLPAWDWPCVYFRFFNFPRVIVGSLLLLFPVFFCERGLFQVFIVSCLLRIIFFLLTGQFLFRIVLVLYMSQLFPAALFILVYFHISHLYLRAIWVCVFGVFAIYSRTFPPWRILFFFLGGVGGFYVLSMAVGAFVSELPRVIFTMRFGVCV